MPDLKHEDAIKQYYESIKDKYPGMTYTDIYLICHTPFKAIVSYMRETRLPHIFIKGLGKFKVFPSKLKLILDKVKENYRRGFYSQERYERAKNFIIQRLKDLAIEDKDKDENEIRIINTEISNEINNNYNDNDNDNDIGNFELVDDEQDIPIPIIMNSDNSNNSNHD